MPSPSEPQRANDLYATLAISSEEARTGTSRILTLPDGRQLPITLPAGVQSGQQLSFTGQGRRRDDGTYGSLQLTITVLPGPPPGGAPGLSSEEAVPTLLSGDRLQLAAPAALASSLPTAGQAALSSSQTPASLPQTPPSPSPSWPRSAPAQRKSASSRRPLWLVTTAVLLLVVISSAALLEQHLQQAQGQASATATSAAATAFVATRQADGQASVVAQATAAAQATASVIAANPNPYPPGGGKLVLYTPLSDAQNSIGWETSIHCTFRSGAYHVVSQDPRYFDHCSNGISYSDFTLEVEMTIVAGDQGGLLFRGADIGNNRYYLFQISTTGIYTLFAYTGGNQAEELTRGVALNYQRGLGQTNLLALVARGHHLTLYLNHQQVVAITDGHYRSGQLALLSVPLADGGQPTEVAYRNLKVWAF
ncbi:family 16 glycoside hydrolase [Thermogemmatispora tikiterensis]|uniref:3-keto-alpha-glucoside-1,2-lyase/3-keto-2-hydroxy-glucal hydratase domain-containing protein n=1 Tax=Thermogemmatispora tikiterensis TaxID=1825093 RepID=A0A328VVI4_9CHLR|nr:family 16 glycoside hydrolase [Thermogemmatispora tikiterensis]RAQ98115.1 hypothetical protein A4R35_21420 [Thermogemmatispora tikiterensis]